VLRSITHPKAPFCRHAHPESVNYLNNYIWNKNPGKICWCFKCVIIDNFSDPVISGKGKLQSLGSFDVAASRPCEHNKNPFTYQCITKLFALPEIRTGLSRSGATCPVSRNFL
jgi:hypothetical protein